MSEESEESCELLVHYVRDESFRNRFPCASIDAVTALLVTAILATMTVGMIRFVGFRKSPARITIMLLLTAFFAIVHGIVAFNMICQPGNGANASENEYLQSLNILSHRAV